MNDNSILKNLKVIELYGHITQTLKEQCITMKDNTYYWDNIELSYDDNSTTITIDETVTVRLYDLDTLYNLIGYATYHDIKVETF